MADSLEHFKKKILK